MILGTLQKHLDNLFALEDNFDKYDYIISVGKKFTGFPKNQHIKENIMHGCQSTVWLIGEKKDNKYYFIGDSDALIVKGVVVIMTEAFSGYTKENLNKFDSDIIQETPLLKSLTMNRQVGMMAMLEYMKRYEI